MTDIGTLPETLTGPWFHDIGHYVNPSCGATRHRIPDPAARPASLLGLAARTRQGRPRRAAVGKGRAGRPASRAEFRL